VEVNLDHATTVSAAAAIVSPWWLPDLSTISAYCALVLPILGVAWLLVQISAKVYITFRSRRAKR
jgi:hypothetical protein